jgi:hypothetical protein
MPPYLGGKSLNVHRHHEMRKRSHVTKPIHNMHKTLSLAERPKKEKGTKESIRQSRGCQYSQLFHVTRLGTTRIQRNPINGQMEPQKHGLKLSINISGIRNTNSAVS